MDWDWSLKEVYLMKLKYEWREEGNGEEMKKTRMKCRVRELEYGEQWWVKEWKERILERWVREWHALCVCTVVSNVLNFRDVFAYITKQILSYVRRSEVCCLVCVCTVTQLGFLHIGIIIFLLFTFSSILFKTT